MSYGAGQKHCWLSKGIGVGSAGWAQLIQIAESCPDQRLYRRLTRAERVLYERALRKHPKKQIFVGDDDHAPDHCVPVAYML
jgi:hypothetical protein